MTRPQPTDSSTVTYWSS